ncbi:MAG TPA: hypothetical protein VLX68_06830 [Chitinivibrionales bacterium]|nr:hypothetical protein [Chitinivibrionales bacterium]
MLLGVQQKKGDPGRLDGRLTVYAVLDIDPADLVSMKHPVASMAHNGLLVAQGNYREQNNLRDFLKSEMGLSLEEGLEDFLDKLGGLESALDPDKLRERIENIDEMEDFIPTPAKIVPFPSEADVLAQEGDVFFAGTFKNIGNAILSVNSLPIMYQARFREQEIHKVRNEIEQLIAQIEKNAPLREQAMSSDVKVEEKIMKEFIPNMLYCRKEKKVFGAAEKQFRGFLKSYRNAEDVDAIVSIIADDHELTSKHFKLLELYAKKIARVMEENFGEAEKLQNDITALKRE